MIEITDEDAVDCAICLAAAPALNTPLRTTHCGHKFCGPCLGVYAAKQPGDKPVLCPLCRAELVPDDIPPTATLSILRASGMPLGLKLISDPESTHATLTFIAEGSSAERAGLRVGMSILAIDDVEISRNDTTTSLTERLRGSDDRVVRLRFSVPRPLSAAQAAAAAIAAEAARLAALPLENSNQLGWTAWCCCCNVTGQIYERTFRKPRCVAVSVALWTCFLVFATADVLGDVFAERERQKTTTGCPNGTNVDATRIICESHVAATSFPIETIQVRSERANRISTHLVKPSVAPSIFEFGLTKLF